MGEEENIADNAKGDMLEKSGSNKRYGTPGRRLNFKALSKWDEFCSMGQQQQQHSFLPLVQSER
eukprot:4229147-Ditylum_brightwellii.AAC.1